MQRPILPYTIVFLLLILGGGFTYFSRNPASPWLEQAQEWPVVGEYAKRFRVAYLGPAAAGVLAEGTLAEGTLAEGTLAGGTLAEGTDAKPAKTRQPRRAAPPPPSEPLRIPEFMPSPKTAEKKAAENTAIELIPVTDASIRQSTPPPPAAPKPAIQYIAQEWVWFLPGQQIKATASPDAATRGDLQAMAYLPVLARDGSWAEVVYRDARGWIDTSQQPPHRRKGARRGLLRQRAEPIRANDSVKLRHARKIMGIDRPSVKIGAYTLYTDSEDQELLTLLDRAASAAEEAYFARYGRLPSGNPKRSVILFASEASYREYSEKSGKLPGGANWSSGHAGSGLLAMFVEGASSETLARTLVHEITHLLNDRSLARSLPPWLEEGMASDLGTVWVEDSAKVAMSGTKSESSNLTVQGSENRYFHLKRLLEKGALPSLVNLISLDREAFYHPENRSRAYDQSFAFIRYLLDGEAGRHAPGFLDFLKRIAGGVQANLLKQLDVSIEALDRGFSKWLGERIQESEQRLEERYRQRRSR